MHVLQVSELQARLEAQKKKHITATARLEEASEEKESINLQLQGAVRIRDAQA